MSRMRPVLIMFAIVAFPASCILAQEKPVTRIPKTTETFAKLNKEFHEVVKAGTAEYRAAFIQAMKDGKGKDFKFDKPFPGPLYSPRFLAIAEKDSEGPEAIDALKMTLKTSLSDLPKPGTVLETRGKAIRILQDYYVAKPAIKDFLSTLIGFDDDDSNALVALVIARNPDRKVQVAAYKEKIANRENVARFAEVAKDPKRLASIEKAQGKDVVKDKLAKAEKARIEIEGMKKTLRTKYGDLYNDLSVGNAAPEIKIQAVDGKEARLSALKGKVVVLDIWATWCGPCKAMIPHERDMVERLKAKPFALVSISADEKKETLTAFLAKEKMPWTHWWNGSEGGIIEDWDVRSFPTIYVIDAQGMIRYKDLRGEALETAVNALLDEAKTKPAKAA